MYNYLLYSLYVQSIVSKIYYYSNETNIVICFFLPMRTIKKNIQDHMMHTN